MAYIREALCWNFEDDNFTWFDASHDTIVEQGSYSPSAYYDALIAIGVNGLWIMDDVGAMAATSVGPITNNLLLDTPYLRSQPSYLNDNRAATAFTGGKSYTLNTGPAPGTGLISSLNYAQGVITSATETLRLIMQLQYGTDPDSQSCVVVYLSTTVIRVEISDVTGFNQAVLEFVGTFGVGAYIIDVDNTAAGVYTVDMYYNFQNVGNATGDAAGTYPLESHAAVSFAYFGSAATYQYGFYKAGGLAVTDIDTLELGYNTNKQDSAPVPTGDSILDGAVCIKYQPDTGWQTRWTDLLIQGKTWQGLSAEGTTWKDFSSGSAEENIYWLTRKGVLIGDQAVKIDGIKEYFVERTQIDLSDVVPGFTCGMWIYAKQLYFHLWSQRVGNSAGLNPFEIAVGWGDTLMDDPDYPVPAVINLQKRLNGGRVKYDFRSTGRYLALRMTFNHTLEIQMTGCELDAEQVHGR